MSVWSKSDIRAALVEPDPESLFREADRVRAQHVGAVVYLRGLVEVSNVCVRSCLYCGLRRENVVLARYRMSSEQFVAAVDEIHTIGLHTVVIQSGDGAYDRKTVCNWIAAIRNRYPDMAITLSLGERPLEDYAAFRDAGADRYLLKHETISPTLYERLHPGQSLEHRLRILEFLKKRGYQVGTGFIVGLPGQTTEDLVDEILFLQQFQPDMVGLGPFLPQRDTPLARLEPGALDWTLRCVALARCVTGNALIPATTALLTLDPDRGLEMGLRAGANVVMISVTPDDLRARYTLYDGRVQTQLEDIRRRIRAQGRTPSGERGDSPKRCGVLLRC